MADEGPWEACITNAGMYVREGALRRALEEGGVVFTGCVKAATKMVAFVRFATEQQLLAGIEAINNVEVKGHKLRAKVNDKPGRVPGAGAHSGVAQDAATAAVAAAGTTGQKRSRAAMESGSAADAEALSTVEPSALPGGAGVEESTAQDVVTPWAGIPYEEQLQKKQHQMEAVAELVTYQLRCHLARKVNLTRAQKTRLFGHKPSLSAHASSSTPAAVGDVSSNASAAVEVTGAAVEATPGEAVVAEDALRTSGAEGEASEDATQSAAASAADVASPAGDEPHAQAAVPAAPAASSAVDAHGIDDEVTALLPEWLRPSVLGKTARMCRVADIVAAPAVDGYRNKIGLTCGMTATGQAVAGHRVSDFLKGTTVAPLTGAEKTVPAGLLPLVQRVNDFLTSSTLPVFDLQSKVGVWRNITLRHATATNDAMLILLAQPPNETLVERLRLAPAPQDSAAGAAAADAAPASTQSSLTLEQVQRMYEAEVQRFTSLFPIGVSGAAAVRADGDAAASTVQSVYLQEWSGPQQPPSNHPYRLLSGAPYLVEALCGFSFQVSPAAFFQVNTRAAERLYGLVRGLALRGVDALAGATHVLLPGCDEMALPHLAHVAVADVCCGTGTIGLVCARNVARIVGVDCVSDAIHDAVANAERNAVSNSTFICDKAEAVMKQILEVASPAAPHGGAAAPGVSRVVAIVDPPRGGLHPSVIRALRTCKPLKRIVYVSCNPSGSFVEDAVKFCTPQDKRSAVAHGPAFRPVVSIPVDLFPHTPHTELVTLLERD